MTTIRSTPDKAALTRFSGEFAGTEDEAAFLRAQLPSSQRQLRHSMLFCSFFYIVFGLADVAALGYRQDTLVLFLGRLTVGLAALAGIWFTRANARCVATSRLVATAVEALAMLVFLLIVSIRPTDMLLHGMSISLMVTIIYIYIPNRLQYAIGVSLAASAAFLVLAALMGNLKPSQLLSMAMLLVLANLFGTVAARRYERLSRVRFHAQQVLTDMSVRDHLTGCFNRRHLSEQLLDAEIGRARRYRLKFTLVMCDLDHFKSINDTFGHHAGDTVLCGFSNLLTSMTRTNVDTVVRYGGEEFLVLLPETDLAGGVEFAERVRIRFAASHMPDGPNRLATSASFGVVAVDFSDEHPDLTQQALIGCADKLMYEAKNGGRNQVRSRQFA